MVNALRSLCLSAANIKNLLLLLTWELLNNSCPPYKLSIFTSEAFKAAETLSPANVFITQRKIQEQVRGKFLPKLPGIENWLAAEFIKKERNKCFSSCMVAAYVCDKQSVTHCM